MLAYIALFKGYLNQIIVENLKFDLTTFGFNDQNSLVPSTSLYRVPAVDIIHFKEKSGGVFLVTTKNAFLPFERVYSMNTYSRISTVP